MTVPADLRAEALDLLSGGEPRAMDRLATGHLAPLVQSFLAGSLTAAGFRAALGGGSAAPPPPSRGGVAVIGLRGVLTPGESLFTLFGFGTAMRGFMRELTEAAADASVKTIVIDADTPGGSVQLIPEAAALVREVRKTKPVVVACSGQLCSAGYWTLSGATRIAATPSARIGSIGVYTTRTSLTRHLEREGIDVEVVSSSPAKMWGHEATRVSDEELQHLREQVAETTAAFEGDVARGRRVSVATVHAQYGRGKCFSASQALARGLIDAVEVNEETVVRAMTAPVRDMVAVRASLMAPRTRLSELSLRGARARMAAAVRVSYAR